MKLNIRKLAIPIIIASAITYGGYKIGKIKSNEDFNNNINNIELENIDSNYNNAQSLSNFRNIDDSLVDENGKIKIDGGATATIFHYVNVDNTPIKEEPNNDSAIREVISKKAVYELVNQPNKDFYEVNYDYNSEQKEYVSTKNSEILSHYNIRAITDTNVRKNPNNNSEILYSLKEYSCLDFINEENGDWYKVNFNGQDAYISAKDSVIDCHTILFTSELKKVAYLIKDSKIYYDSKLEDEICSIPKLECIEVYGESDDYYVVSTISADRKVGFINKNDTKDLQGNFAIIDLTDLAARAYKDNKTVISGAVIPKATEKSIEGLYVLKPNENHHFFDKYVKVPDGENFYKGYINDLNNYIGQGGKVLIKK